MHGLLVNRLFVCRNSYISTISAPNTATMTDQDHGQVSVQLRPRITHQSDRPGRKRNFTPAKRKSTTSLSLSKHQNSQMAMPSSSGPQLRQSRRRSSAHTSDHVGAHDMSAHSSRPGTGFTKTGRISKALKGVKVHECDQCGKVRCS